jgi:DNA repair exonuclease SbcCD ATPase subunit
MTITDLRYSLEQRKGKRIELENSIQTLRTNIREGNAYLENLEQVREIINHVGALTQESLQFHISDIASLALEGIFPDPYKLVLDFVKRRNKNECDIVFERDGEKLKPLDASGGGTVDVASFALRIASWSMAVHKTSPVIVLDEPMRFLSEEYQESASEMIKEISRKLGIQFIVVTHNETLASYADKTFKITIKKGISQIKEN